MRSAGRPAVAVAAALAALGALAGCLLELPSVCGDGRIDAPDEQCDPAIDDGQDCDPITCQLPFVAMCGNGQIDPGEQCDGANINNATCPSGKGILGCTADCELDESNCDPCGNGRLEPTLNEECERTVLGTLAQPQPCSNLSSPDTKKPYTSGQYKDCVKDTCKWYRGGCGYCGDNQADLPQSVDVNNPVALSEREVCDGDASQLNDLTAYCDDNCPEAGMTCRATCQSDCQAFAPPADDLRCCVPSGDPCPFAGDPAPCCLGYEADLADPFDDLKVCENQASKDGFQSVCSKTLQGD
jgi:hypothetical protein